MIRDPHEPAESEPLHSQGILSHHHIPEPDVETEEGSTPSENMRRVIFATRIDDEGKRVTQIIAEVFEQPGFPEQGAANADRLVECWNRFEESAETAEEEPEPAEIPDIGASFSNAINQLIAYALTCRSDNPVWLREMARAVNKVAVQIGDPDRAEFDEQDGLRIVKQMEGRDDA